MPEGLETCVLYLEVKDSGMGVTEDVCSKLFQAFMQGDNSTSQRFGGTGLGLAISKNLVSLMGGHIGCSSHVGQVNHPHHPHKPSSTCGRHECSATHFPPQIQIQT